MNAKTGTGCGDAARYLIKCVLLSKISMLSQETYGAAEAEPACFLREAEHEMMVETICRCSFPAFLTRT